MPMALRPGGGAPAAGPAPWWLYTAVALNRIALLLQKALMEAADAHSAYTPPAALHLFPHPQAQPHSYLARVPAVCCLSKNDRRRCATSHRATPGVQPPYTSWPCSHLG